MEEITLLIADDHPLIREGLRKVLELETGMCVVGEAADGLQALELARRLNPRIVLMDINMPGMNGIEATRAIKQELSGTDVIALTIHDDEQYVLELIQAGVSGYLLKDIEAAEMVQAIRSVARGESVIHPAMAGKLFGELRRERGTARVLEELTAREREVLVEIARGQSNREIADRLCISQKTVKNHLTSIFRKLELEDRTQAALFAVRHRLVEP